MRKTRIVCTIGPGVLDDSKLLHLYQEGMSVARLNGSHADLDWHLKAIKKINRILPDLPILLDIPGRKIRTVQLKHEPIFSVGETIILTTDISCDDVKKVPVNYSGLHEDLAIGNTVMADDGSLRFTVIKIENKDIYCRAEVAGQLKSRKGINVPFVKLNTPLVTPRDEGMIAFACENKVDYIGLSFVESADHVEAFRNLIKVGSPRIVAKVENQRGLDNVREIAQSADAIMIDRGDLTVETTLYDVALKQKYIIDVAREYGRPVIVATEMLHTMITNPFPTKSEICDISNAVLDGCSATMLSGETAVGDFPLESVATMRKVIDATEKHLNQHENLPSLSVELELPEAISNAIPMICKATPVTKIVAVTRSGYAARMIAKHRLIQPILAVSDDYYSAKSFNLISGTQGIYSPLIFSKDSADHILGVLKMLYEERLLEKSDLVLIAGVSYPTAGKRMNTLQIHDIGALAANFNW